MVDILTQFFFFHQVIFFLFLNKLRQCKLLLIMKVSSSNVLTSYYEKGLINIYVFEVVFIIWLYAAPCHWCNWPVKFSEALSLPMCFWSWLHLNDRDWDCQSVMLFLKYIQFTFHPLTLVKGNLRWVSWWSLMKCSGLFWKGLFHGFLTGYYL